MTRVGFSNYSPASRPEWVDITMGTDGTEFKDSDPYGDFMEGRSDPRSKNYQGHQADPYFKSNEDPMARPDSYVSRGTATVLREIQCPIYPDCQGQGCLDNPSCCRYLRDLARAVSDGNNVFYDAATNRVVIEDPGDPTEGPPKDDRTWAQRRFSGLDLEDE